MTLISYAQNTRTSLAGLIIFLASCNPSGNTSGDRQYQLKLDNYFLAGKRLYETKCSNCHQDDGTGLGSLYPPLDNSDYLKSDPLRIVCISKWGFKEEIIVNGVQYNQIMPANEKLTQLEIAEISTYVLNSWSNKYGLVSIDSVRVRLDSCAR